MARQWDERQPTVWKSNKIVVIIYSIIIYLFLSYTLLFIANLSSEIVYYILFIWIISYFLFSQAIISQKNTHTLRRLCQAKPSQAMPCHEMNSDRCNNNSWYVRWFISRNSFVYVFAHIPPSEDTPPSNVATIKITKSQDYHELVSARQNGKVQWNKNESKYFLKPKINKYVIFAIRVSTWTFEI